MAREKKSRVLNKEKKYPVERIVFITLILFLLPLFPRLSPRLEASIESNETEEDKGVVQIVAGDTRIFSTNKPTRVAISNPNIADIVDVTNSQITVEAKAPGSTTLVYMDIQGEQSVKIRVMPEDMQEIQRRVDKILETLNLSEVYTQALPDEGKVMILGKVNRVADKERMVTALGDLKNKSMDLTLVKEEEAVVEIDVQVLEIDKGSTKVLGFTWPSGVTGTEVGSPGIAQQGASSVTNTGGLVSAATTLTNLGTKWGTLFRVVNISRDAFQFSIDALVQEGKARVLSRPRLACQSGKEAELFVGGEKPIFTTNVASATGAQGTNIDYKEYGIKLKVQPTITDANSIKLSLNVEVSEIGDAETIGTASTGTVTAKAYPLTKRSASTELFVNDSQTLAIGGLIRQKNEESVSKVPGLGDIPIIGAAFRRKATKIGGGAGERGNTELFILLTPTIIASKTGSSQPEKQYANQYPASVTTGVTVSENQREKTMSVLEYSSLVQRRILQTLIYPNTAKEAGFHGIVKLGLHISYVGDLLEAVVKKSSGYKILDDNALKAAKGIGTYPPFPSSVDLKDIWIDIPIIYKVD